MTRMQTTDLGFIRLLEMLERSTSGLKASELVAPVCAAGASVNRTPLKRLLKTTEKQWQTLELTQLIEEIKIEAKREKARAAYRQWYLDSKATVTEHNPALRDAQKVDKAIATAVLEQTKTPTDVGRILSQSDVAVAIREHEPNSYVATEKVYHYVNDLYQRASRELEQQQRFQQQMQQDVQVEIEV